MKVILLADSNSTHTIKWALSLSKRGINIYIFSLSKLIVNSYKNSKNIEIKSANQIVKYEEGKLSKIKYLKIVPILKEYISKVQPDVVHAHYASSYGLLGALSKFHPFVISVWGSDVFDFPNNSIIHKNILKINLRKADKILSTSKVMATETQQYTNKPIEITPFGIDTKQFAKKTVKSIFNKNDIIVGTIKSLEPVYGIEHLINAFKIVSDKHPKIPLKLLIIGGGSQEKKLKLLVKDLNIEDQTIFVGKILHSEVPRYLNMLSIFVALSNKESFGVSIIEASACKLPVVVSNVGGLPEVVENKKSGYIVPAQNPEQAAKKIEMLVLDSELRQSMGDFGREWVKRTYNWTDNVDQMISIYNKMLKND